MDRPFRNDFWRLDPDPEGQKRPTKIGKKCRNFMLLSAGCSFCGLKVSPVAWTFFKDAYEQKFAIFDI